MIHELLINVPGPLREVVLADASAPLTHGSEQPVAPAKDPIQEKLREQESEALQRILANLAEIAAELQAQECTRLEEMQQVAVELAVAIASRLVHERIAAGEYAVETLVRQAVSGLKTGQPITIHLNPQDLDLLEKRLTKIQPPPLDLNKLHFVADAHVDRGDCRAEAGETSVLSQIQEQLAGIRKHLLETLPEATLDRRRPLPAARRLKRFPDRRHTA